MRRHIQPAARIETSTHGRGRRQCSGEGGLAKVRCLCIILNGRLTPRLRSV